MNNNNFDFFDNWFDNYVDSFFCEDEVINENIILKKEHTKRVCDNIRILGENLKLDQDELKLAEIIALFHDVGRFRQFKLYKTFNDRISENHALLGIKVLNESEILNILREDERQLVLKAIQYHNMLKIPQEKNEKCTLFSKLIRDADKLDIYKVFIDNYSKTNLKPNASIEHNLPQNEEYSKIIVEDILNNKISDNKNVKSTYDMRLLTVAWLFDINYKKTLELIKERKYIEKIFEALPKNDEMCKLKEHVCNL